MEKMSVVMFRRRAAAEPIRNRLVEAGVDARIVGEGWTQKFWFVPQRVAGTRVEVPGEQFERAGELLHRWDVEDGALREAIHCPECGSLRVQFPQYAHHSLLNNLVLGAAAGMHIVDKYYYCEDCHFTWPKRGTRTRRARRHMAPYYFLEGVEQNTPPVKTKSRAAKRPTSHHKL